MNNYLKSLNNKEWSEHYNMNCLDQLISSIESGAVSIWSKELMKICSTKATTLEIGCGSGASSLWLAKNGLNATAIDYTESSVELVKTAAIKLGINNIEVINCDATKPLPFKDKQFDYIFQAGLLEHFETEMQISLLREWSKYGKHMISMIPNSASIPYRVGKILLEKKEEWEYGLEVPKHSFQQEFIKAGISVEKEYTIGTEWAQRFLPKKHYIKKFFSRLEKDGYDLDDLMQGYLLVTIGKCD